MRKNNRENNQGQKIVSQAFVWLKTSERANGTCTFHSHGQFKSYGLTVKVPISCLGILHICNLWILLRKIVLYFVGRKFYLRGFVCC